MTHNFNGTTDQTDANDIHLKVNLHSLELDQDQSLAASLPDLTTKNITAITSLHAQETQNIPKHQKNIERIATFFGRPAVLYILLILLTFWIGGGFFNHLLPFHLPSFRWQDEGLSAAELLISTGVLVRQAREERFSEKRSQLMLHLMLMSEQKIAKSIALLEELRNDLPNVTNRPDPEAQVMKEVADPIAVLESIKETLAQKSGSAREVLPNVEETQHPQQSMVEISTD